MSQIQSSEFTPAAQNDSLLIQQKLSMRQAKRAAKAAERRRISDALKEEGNVFFCNGNFLDALDRYQQAVALHGPAAKPVLLTNLAATYLKLEMYPEAHDAADRALAADPRSAKARYRRAMARKHMEMWTAAETDFHTLLILDPGNKDIEAKLAYVEERRCNPRFWEEIEEDMTSYSDYEAPALEDDPQLVDSLSESSDCEHTGNGIPCKFYNRYECKNGHACRYSHAPDEKSERDALGRNVCRYYLIGICKFGERCSYLHSKEHLLQHGWWSTEEGLAKERRRYELIKMCNKAIADHNNHTKASRKGKASKKKPSKGKRRGDSRSCPTLEASGFGMSTINSFETGQSSKRTCTKGKKIPTAYSYSGWGGYNLNSDGDYDNGMFGFTDSDVNELLCQGVKPWDDDAWDVLGVLRGY